MSNDSFTEITRRSWLGRIGQSVVGVIVGLILIIVAAVLLFWNEGRAVQTARSLAEGRGLVIDVDPSRIDPANEGKLIHVSGELKTNGRISDPIFGISTDGVRLQRDVEMYQWKEDKHSETHKNLGGSEETVTTYTYSRGWSAQRVDSSKFRHPEGHGNPEMRYHQTSVVSKDATLGNFHPGAGVLAGLPASEEVAVDAAAVNDLRGRLSGQVRALDGGFYLGSDSGAPQIGDLRVTFRTAPQGPASIVGEQRGKDFAEYQTEAGDRLLMVKPGTISAAAMFKEAADENRTLTWVLRLVGVIAMWIGCALLFAPIATIADVIPLLGDVVGAGAALASLAVTAVVATAIIAVAWFWYRPVIALAALVVGAVALFGIRALAGRRASKPAAAH